METTHALRSVLASVFLMYFKAHSSHWNVQGPLFHPMHQYFGILYTQVFAEVDVIAEQIRALGEMAPNDLMELLQAPLSLVSPIPYEVNVMLGILMEHNEEVLQRLYTAHAHAEAEEHDGVVGFIETLIDAHAKIGWQLKAQLA